MSIIGESSITFALGWWNTSPSSTVTRKLSTLPAAKIAPSGEIALRTGYMREWDEKPFFPPEV